MPAVVAVVRAAPVGEPTTADPLVSFATDGVQDSGPPVIEDEQDHADQVLEASPGQIEDPEQNSPKAPVAVALGGQLDMFTSTFWASRIQSHIELLSLVFS